MSKEKKMIRKKKNTHSYMYRYVKIIISLSVTRNVFKTKSTKSWKWATQLSIPYLLLINFRLFFFVSSLVGSLIKTQAYGNLVHSALMWSTSECMRHSVCACVFDIMDGVAASLGDDDGLDRTVRLIERALAVLPLCIAQTVYTNWTSESVHF